jgi:hypothetical protein
MFSSAALLLAMTGCSALATMNYVWNPKDTKAEYDDLEGAKTVVVCRATSSAFSDPTISRDLATQVSLLLKTNVSKIDIVSEQKVSDWCDRNRWSEYPQIGRALKADKVVGIDIERFNIRQGSTLLQGDADIRITVHDMKDGGKLAYQKQPKTIKFPPNSPISSAERSEGDFRNQFVRVLGAIAARNFYEYDSREFQATDSMALQ